MQRLLIAFLSMFSIVLFADNTNKLQDIINKAVENGEKCVKLEGWYNLGKPLVLTSKHSGLTIDGQGKTVFCGGKKITNWQKDGKFWKAKVNAKEVYSLYVNGKRAEVAQTKVASIYSGSTTNSVFVRADDVKSLIGLSEAQLKGVYFDEYDAWRNWHCPILKLSPTQYPQIMCLSMSHMIENGFWFFKNDKAPRFRLCNVRAELDAEGEFFFDIEKSEVWYCPRKNEDINTAQAYYPVLEQIVCAHGDAIEIPLKDITIKGVEFFCGKSQQGVGNGQQAAIKNSAFIHLKNVDNVLFENNKVHGTNLYGLSCVEGSHNIKIKENEFFDLGCGAIRIGETPTDIIRKSKLHETYGVVVCNNLIYGFGKFMKSAVGLIVLDASDVHIENNTIFDGHYTAISSGWTWGYNPTRTKNIKILNNRIFKIGYGYLHDMGGIYTLGAHDNSVISGNEISEVITHKEAGGAIYNDEGSAGFIVENNYVHDVDDDCYHQHYGINNIVRNNIFAYGKYSQIALSRRGGKYPNQLVFERNIVVYKSPQRIFRRDKMPIERLNGTFDKNIYWNESGDVQFCEMPLAQWQEKFGQDKNSYIVNPQLNNGKLGNDEYKKIGFKPFSTKDAGVVGKMKDRLTQILKTYHFPEVVRFAKLPTWTTFYQMGLSNKRLGSQPDCIVSSAKGGKDVTVRKDNSGKFLRFVDMTLKTAHFMPCITINNASLAENETALFTCDIRVNKTSTFFAELRGDTGFPGAIVQFKNGYLVKGKEKIQLPQDKWISLEIVLKISDDKNYIVKLCDGKNVLAEFTAKYEAPKMNFFKEIVIAQTSNTQDYYFDIKNIFFRSKEMEKSK